MALQLHVRVVEAWNISTGGTVKLDPICTLTLSPGNETKKTKPIFNNPRPQWNEEFHFNLTIPAQSVLTVTLCNKDPIANIPLSRVQVNVFELPVGQVFDSPYPMTAVKKMNSPGEVRLVLQVAPAGMQPWVAPAPCPGQAYGAPPGPYPQQAAPYPAPAAPYPGAPPPGAYPPQGAPAPAAPYPYPPQGAPPPGPYPPQGAPPGPYPGQLVGTVGGYPPGGPGVVSGYGVAPGAYPIGDVPPPPPRNNGPAMSCVRVSPGMVGATVGCGVAMGVAHMLLS
jgi:hypothetical protein